jgi:hypothetical protein
MMIATYPVFTDVAAAAGKLLSLQGSFTLAHLTRRLVSTWGERSTLSRASQRVVRSMIQWGVLEDTATPGVYRAASGRRPVGPTVGILLIEGLLIDAEESSIPVDQLVGHPALFPFRISVNAGHLRAAPQLQVHRHGLDTDVVELRPRCREQPEESSREPSAARRSGSPGGEAAIDG